MKQDQCEICGIIDTLFQINHQAVCGACYEEVKESTRDRMGLINRTARAKQEIATRAKGNQAYIKTMEALYNIRRELTR